jgi:hypothetical protein
MGIGAPPGDDCQKFNRGDRLAKLDPRKLHRFVVGQDTKPREVPAGEAKELGDPFATLLLLKNIFPRTTGDCLKLIDKHAKKTSPLRKQMVFVLGEGSQIAPGKAVQRNMRFVITRGSDANGPEDGPDILISAFTAEATDTEVMAWDRRRGGFNYYKSLGGGPTWVFAGNSRDALLESSERRGVFDPHRSGAFIMKELKFPWLHWDSIEVPVSARVFGDRVPEWFKIRERGGAYIFEPQVAIPAIERWAKRRFDDLVAGGVIERPERIMRQILASETANLVSSRTESGVAAASAEPFDLPSTFFVDADGLAAVGLAGNAPFFSVKGGIYRKTREKFKVRLEDSSGFKQRGDTHFAFAVPERALEDQAVLRQAIRVGLVSKRLAASLLMVDFPNPVFSEKRKKLLDHVPTSAPVKDGKSTFSKEMAGNILKAAAAPGAGDAEKEFAKRWNVGVKFKADFDSRLGKYFKAVEKQLATQAGFDGYFRLAESRRTIAKEMSAFGEFELLFAVSDAPAGIRTMRADGTVA